MFRLRQENLYHNSLALETTHIVTGYFKLKQLNEKKYLPRLAILRLFCP